MSNKSEHLGIKVEPEFINQLEKQAQKKGLNTSTYARMKLKEAV